VSDRQDRPRAGIGRHDPKHAPPHARRQACALLSRSPACEIRHAPALPRARRLQHCSRARALRPVALGEGHAIQYAITATADRIELVSDEAPGQPRFRLRYDRHGADELAVEFAIAMPGAPEFRHYTGGVVHRAR
jgi:hypothetical protein